MVKLKTIHRWKDGQKNVIPFLGEVQIGEDGIIEAPDQETANKIVELQIGFELVKESVDTTTTTTTQEPTTTTTTTTEEPTTTTTQEPVTTTTTTTTEEPIAPKIEEDELGKKEGDDELSPAEKQHALSHIDNATVAQLQEMAKAFPKKEWEGLRKAELQEYLKNQLQ